MSRMIVRRLVYALPLVFLVTLVGFGLGNISPTDPARMALTAGGTGVQVDAQELEAKRQELGLDRPIHERYASWVGGMLRGDFGNSYRTGRPVAVQFVQRLPASLLLGTLALVTALVLAIPMGMLAGVRSGGSLDLAARMLAVACTSVPGFWLALLLIWFFAAHLKWLPAMGSFTPAGTILPVLVLALRPLGRLVRLMRATTLEVLNAEFIKVEHGKGITSLRIMSRHVLPNALLPIVAVIGLDLAALIANSAVIEWVFAWPGIGRMGVDAAVAGDLPVLMAFTVLVSCVVILANLMVDIVYGAMDPRLREEVNR